MESANARLTRPALRRERPDPRGQGTEQSRSREAGEETGCHPPTNPSPSAYGEWPGRINRKAGISFRRCGPSVRRLAVVVSFELRRCQ